MSSLLATAESLVISRLMENQAPLTGKSKAGLGLMALAGLLLTISALFFIYAAYLWLNENYTPEMAATLTGAILVILATFCTLISYAILQYRRYKLNRIKQEVMHTVHDVIELADEELAKSIKENPKSSMLVASIAGFIVGEKFC